MLAKEASGPCCLKACLDGGGSRGTRSGFGVFQSNPLVFRGLSSYCAVREEGRRVSTFGGEEEDEAEGCTPSGAILPLSNSQCLWEGECRLQSLSGDGKRWVGHAREAPSWGEVEGRGGLPWERGYLFIDAARIAGKGLRSRFPALEMAGGL